LLTMPHHENPELDAIYSRITAIEQRMESRFDTGSDRMSRIEQMLAENSASTEEVREIVVMGKSFFKVLGHLGNGIKWSVSVGAAIAAIWYATKEWWAK
jgi:glutamine synthetase type III